jgi:hypothetical protein
MLPRFYISAQNIGASAINSSVTFTVLAIFPICSVYLSKVFDEIGFVAPS